MKNAICGTAAVLALGTSLVFGQDTAAPTTTTPPATTATRARTGYLTADVRPDVVRIVPPAPSAGDARFVKDMAIFHSTRALEGSPRWLMALSDDSVSMAGIFRAFQCALGILLTQDNAPKVTALITKANVDAGGAAGLLKNLYQHKRPFQVDDAQVCLSNDGRTALEKSPDYPSGHTTASWEAGLILAELLPEASGSILERARAFGQSRVVCGVHNESAVEAGWMTATVIFAAQNGSPAFRADLESARAELMALRTPSAEKTQRCVTELETLSNTPF